MRLLLGLTLLLLPTALAAQTPDSLTRAEIWKALRYEKAETVRPYEPLTFEATVRALESSADDGLLAESALGVPVAVWLVVPVIWLGLWGLLLMLRWVACLALRAGQRRERADRLAGVSRWAVAGVALVLTLVAVPLAADEPAPPYTPLTLYPDDPLWTDPDTLDLPVPEPLVISHFFDFFRSNFGDADSPDGPAVNVNTLGEVPNSSWYTNRHAPNRLTPAQIRRGPLPGTGPADGTWTVVDAKDDGKTPGFQIEDATGTRFLLKFDPYDFPELVTGAEAVATRLFWALGYHVPANVVVRFRSEQLRAEPDGDLTPDALDRMLERVHRYPDGTYRAVASRFLSGKPIGPFTLRGTRPDDANDVFPHENRRELRGLRVFSAWLHHIDLRSPNSLDMLVTDGDTEYVRHHLIDFGSTLGAGPFGPITAWSGREYALEVGPNLLRGLTFGLVDGAPDVPAAPHRGIGRIDGASFEPTTWKPQQPNDAFRRMKPADAFWAAKYVARFTRDEIAAAVAAAQFSDPAAAAYLTDVLMERRDKIAAAYLGFAGGLDRFRVENDTLHFDDLQHLHGLTDQPPPRTVTWYAGPGDPWMSTHVRTDTTAQTALPLPATDAPHLTAQFISDHAYLTVYLRRDDTGWRVVARLPH